MRRRAEVDRLVGSAASFERPISVALLTTAFFIAWAYPFAPLILWEVVGLVLLIPVLRILLPTVPESARPVLGLLAVFYLIDSLRELMTSTPLLERTAFFLEIAIAAGVLVFLQRPSRMRMLSTDDSALFVLGLGLRVALVGLTTSFLANLLGFLAFARLVGEGSLSSIYLGLMAYACYRIATTLLVVFLSSHRFDAVGVIRQNADDLLKWGVGSLPSSRSRSGSRAYWMPS